MTIKYASAYDEVYDFLTSEPTPQQIVEFRPSETTQERVRYLLESNREGKLTQQETAELEEFGKVEHLMRMLKLTARQKLTGA